MKNITNCCLFCGVSKSILVEADHFDAWQCGVLAQDAMPNLTISDREFLISKVCPTCFDSMTESDEESDEESDDLDFDCDSDDGDALASAGHGTDEDYGYFGDGE